ncbi:hypothetical protein TspCOW1_19690 [Thiohalobacter sp. COW1]|uniref:hypothetical protein n=1 Tax=Thiohalobacter sp. COW1 TaxID=2795687 RepID=UPI0019168EF9|nr:hypothetical protein [Thiohalobacter sp. COW1]BCO31866.1 hypothetical protein TspCOW1_19690 [Thiohalobacter sp. COW1]
MSEADKTGEKLVASMRKTKAGAGSASGAAKKSTAASGKASAGRKPAARKSKPTPAAPVTDPYQSGRRVWPD